jgi:hypothetical protein
LTSSGNKISISATLESPFNFRIRLLDRSPRSLNRRSRFPSSLIHCTFTTVFRPKIDALKFVVRHNSSHDQVSQKVSPQTASHKKFLLIPLFLSNSHKQSISPSHPHFFPQKVYHHPPFSLKRSISISPILTKSSPTNGQWKPSILLFLFFLRILNF